MENNEVDTKINKNQKLFEVPMRLLGFGVAMSWHLLLLYSPLIITPDSILNDRMFFQGILNAGLAVSFLIFALVGGKFVLPLQPFKETNFLGILGAVSGALGSIILLYFSKISFVLSILGVVICGIGSATLMFVWIALYSEAAKNYTTILLSSSMVLAGVISFLTRYLQPEIGALVMVALPIIAGLGALINTDKFPVRSSEHGERGIPNIEEAALPFIRAVLVLSVVALIFGTFQGSANQEGFALLNTSSPVAYLGASVAGLTVLFLHHFSKLSSGVRPTINFEIGYRTAFGVFAFCLALIPFVTGMLNVFISFLIMFVFILLDVVIIIYVVELIRTFDLNVYLSIGLNRSPVYACFALGAVIGYFTISQFGTGNAVKSGISLASFTLIVLVLIVFMPAKVNWFSTEGAFQDSNLQDEDDQPVTPDGRMPFRLRCQGVSEYYQLSPRETEVLSIIAKGRNAEYVENLLGISNHTAKTHIANIYRKLDVHSSQELLDVVDNYNDED